MKQNTFSTTDMMELDLQSLPMSVSRLIKDNDFLRKQNDMLVKKVVRLSELNSKGGHNE